MAIADFSAWALWLVVITLTLILYLRVDAHDWGMVGMTIFLFGASVLVTRSLLRMYDLDHGGTSSLYVWRGLVIIGAPIAIAGYVAGILREPPPWRQVVVRLTVLVFVAAVLTFVAWA